ncbi:hypothetical protein [Bradyrhizobium diazoefficiens]|uniref:Uncharacterized protein n=1 Tax=Bradyrhizobium diazoefficiens TaxID=1355477 RepID=A0A809YF50_9BRAD|nr:hypothetical protein [Bradyrhizobium diazoefficiens]BCA00456.1 hypothetical protein H12S4_13600 [Bradyrhizobium diazoefficiens]BCA18138.1 hypothetical protein BDHH15_13530 [Bradyrhizobium diazoefficiens]BCE36321.1 hypothetical protein XF3B_13520 [Bradyrhizobium diazoefficiens]BCF49713.1 hypothetical protein XF17B_13510 [Bradyrhizobium diazoefficiens]
MSISSDRDDLQQASVYTNNNDLPGTPASRERATLDALAAHQQSLKDLAAAQLASEQAARASSPSLVRTNTATNASITMSQGKASIVSGSAHRATAVSSPRPGMVTVGGITTTVEAAKAGGLIPQDYQPGFNAGVAAAPQSNQQQPQFQQQPQSNDDNTIKATAEQAKAINASTAAIEQANEAIGNFAVSSLLEDAVVSGDIPSTPPRGVSAEQVSAVVAGFEAQANAVLSETGASVSLLNDLLNESELRAARLATYRGNDRELRDLGNKAMDRLTKLPNDPALFKAMTADWHDIQITRGKDGDTLVRAPGWPKAISWSAAVKQRLITPG